MTDSVEYFRWLFRMTVSDDFSGWLFRMTISGDYSGCLFQITVPDDYFEWLFRMPVSYDCSRWLFRMTIPDACFRWLFRMTVWDAYFRWLFQMTVRDSTTESYFSDELLFPQPIPISTNHLTGWSHDWFVFERRLPTAELWPWSPPDSISIIDGMVVLQKVWKHCSIFGLYLNIWWHCHFAKCSEALLHI